MALYLGVDAGGSKTLAVIVNQEGRVKGVGLAGSGNFQQPEGEERAREEILLSMDLSCRDANIELEEIEGAFFGMAGADRPKDFAIVKELLSSLAPFPTWGFENDVYIGLVAALQRTVGVGVVCGSGTNVLGFNQEGRRVQIGGMGYLFGDYAGGKFLTTLAIHRAVRGHEGRGDKTLLYDLLCEAYQIEDLLDLVDILYEGGDLKLEEKTPLVFQGALLGDRVALELLEEMARDLGISALAAMDKLFSSEERAPVVAMGGVFQGAPSSLFYEPFVKTVREGHPEARVSLLEGEPVFGAIYSALLLCGEEITPSFCEHLHLTFPGRKERGF